MEAALCRMHKLLILTVFLSHGALFSFSCNCTSTNDLGVPTPSSVHAFQNWPVEDDQEVTRTGLQRLFRDAGVVDLPSCVNVMTDKAECDEMSTVGKVYTQTVHVIDLCLDAASKLETLLQQMKQRSQSPVNSNISFGSSGQLTVNMATLEVARGEWHSSSCGKILGRCSHVNGSEERLRLYHVLSHCFRQAVDIMNSTLCSIEQVCRINALQESMHGSGTNGSIFPLAGLCNARECQTECTCTRSWNTSSKPLAISPLSCYLHQSAAVYRLVKTLISLAIAEKFLDRFRLGLSATLRPSYLSSWNIFSEMSLAVCSSIFIDTFSNEPDLKLCSRLCYDTFQLLTALKAIQPDVFEARSQQGRILQFLEEVFNTHCWRPESRQCAAGNGSSTSELFQRNMTCIMAIPSPNSTHIVGHSVLVVAAHKYPYCTSTVYINVSCQYPFVPVSSDALQSEKMKWLAAELTRTACDALNRSDCAVPSTLLHCNMICEAVWFQEARDTGLLQIWLNVIWAFAIAACISTAFALVTFIRNYHRIRSPARRAVVCMNLGIFMSLLDYSLVPFKRASVVVNGACTAENAITVLESTGASACGFSSFHFYFSAHFVIISGACAGHAWHSLVVKLTSASSSLGQKKWEERLSYLYFGCALTLSLIVTGVIMAVQRVKGTPPYYWCTTDVKTAFYTFTVPYLILAGYGLVCLITSIPRLRKLMRSRRSLSYHSSRRCRAGGTASETRRKVSSSTRGLVQLLKLLSVYMFIVSVHILALIVDRTPAFISEIRDSSLELDKDGTRTHSECLMSSRSPTEDCSYIQQRSITIEMTFHIATILLCIVFSTWAYNWEYWKDAYLFRTLRGSHSHGSAGAQGLFHVVRRLLALKHPIIGAREQQEQHTQPHCLTLSTCDGSATVHGVDQCHHPTNTDTIRESSSIDELTTGP
eukprot:scpid31310/ scgid8418/ 